MSEGNRKGWVDGVATRLSEKHGVNVYLIRLLFVVSFFVFGLGLVMYWLLWDESAEENHQIRLDFSH